MVNLNNPEQTARFLALLGYQTNNIARALVRECDSTPDEAARIAGEATGNLAREQEKA